MLRLSSEAKVGLFVMLGLILLVYMSLRVGGIRFGKAEGYELYVKFDSVAGIDKDASVRVAGVEVGRVRDISLEKNKARVTLMIKRNVKIGNDFVAVLTTKGLLGERYIELIPGSPGAPPLEPGDEIKRTKRYSDMEKLITLMSDVATDIKKVSTSFASVFGGPEGEGRIKDIVVNIDELSGRLNRLVAANDERFTRTMANFERFSQLLNKEGPGIARGLKDLTRNLNGVIAENRDTVREGIGDLAAATVKMKDSMVGLKRMVANIEPKVEDFVTTMDRIAKKIDTGEGTIGKLINDPALNDNLNRSMAAIDSIARKIDTGEGTIGKLVNDPETHENINKALKGVGNYVGRIESFRTILAYRGEYLTNADETKSYFSLRLQPRRDKYYLLGIVDDPRGQKSVETREITEDGTKKTIKEVKTRDKLKFNAQFAKRFGDLTLRGGLLESTGGFAVDYSLFDDDLEFTFEAFDFNKDRNPHLKVGLTYNLKKYFFLTGGYDDFVSKIGLESIYLGGGFRFDDEDLKYIMGQIPVPSF